MSKVLAVSAHVSDSRWSRRTWRLRAMAFTCLAIGGLFFFGSPGGAQESLPLPRIIDFVMAFTASNSNPSNITPLQIGSIQNVIFTATTATQGTELWRSDGTTAGTVLVKDIEAGVTSSNPSNLVSGKSGGVNVVYFTATTSSAGTEIWKTDGTTAGTVMIIDLVGGSGSSDPQKLTPTTAGGFDTCYFTATTPTTGRELYRTNGTSGTTTLIADIVSGSGSSNPAEITPIMISNVQNVMFTATTASQGTELWRSNGSPFGTVIVKDILPGSVSSNPHNLQAGISVPVNVVYFAATTTAEGTELWKSDGTLGGTQLILDIVAGSGSSDPQGITPSFAGSSDGVYFSATTASGGRELWRSNGTAGTTFLVKDIEAGAGSSNPSNITQMFLVSNWIIVFTATTTSAGTELWRSDGTAAGTVLVKDIVAGSGSSNPTSLIKGSVGGVDTVYFVATTATEGTELWRTDSTTAGTVLVADIVAGSGSSTPQNLLTTTAGGTSTVYFSATTPAAGRELWRSNGTAVTTVLVKDIN